MCRCPSRLHRVGHDRDRGIVVCRLGRQIDDCLLDAHPRRPEVPLHLRRQSAEAVEDDVSGSDAVAIAVDGDMDRVVRSTVATSRPISGAKGRVVAQRRRPSGQDGRPRTLLPSQRSRVVDVDAWMHDGQLTSSYQPADVVIAESGGEQLPAGDDTRLIVKQYVESRIHACKRA